MGMLMYLCVYLEEPKKLQSQTIILIQIKFSGVQTQLFHCPRENYQLN